MSDRCEPMGYKEIAAYLEVKEKTVTQWNYLGRLPDPDFEVHGMPAWAKTTILRWAGETGRARSQKLRRAYRALTGLPAADADRGGRMPAGG